MSLQNLNNLAKTGQLKIEPLINKNLQVYSTGQTRLKDACNTTLAKAV